MAETKFERISIDGRALEYTWIKPACRVIEAPALVMLHEGLGSITMWRGFPQRLADASGCEVLVYSRAGYGGSAPVPPYDTGYMHHEGLVVLPELLRKFGFERPVLFGHSDGGSIALLCAADGGVPLSGIIVLAPHVLVEDVTVDGIAATSNLYRTTDMRGRLGRYHADVDEIFAHWRDIWLNPVFRDWNIEAYLSRIRCPVLAIQGEDDEYATMTQIDRIAAGVSGEAELLKLAQCGHSPHRDQPQKVLAATAAFVAKIRHH